MLFPSPWSARVPGLLAACWLLAAPSRPLLAAPLKAGPKVTPVDAPEGPTPRSASQQATALATAALLAAVSQGTLQAVEPTLHSVDIRLQARKTAGQPDAPRGVKYLMIGDSLSVGGFGEAMIPYLASRSDGRLALFASCGSAPEHWLAGEPEHTTRCGFRKYVQDPSRREYFDFENGHAPAPHPTPKIENLLREYRPTTVIVQLGTNWMDMVEAKGVSAASPKLISYLDRFTKAVRGTLEYRPTLIWIAPPDSAKFSRTTEQGVLKLIRDAGERSSFKVIDSNALTNYHTGSTGGDGVHYSREASFDWARKVQKKM